MSVLENRVASISKYLYDAVSTILNDESIQVMRQDTASAAHIQARIEELIEQSLSSGKASSTMY